MSLARGQSEGSHWNHGSIRQSRCGHSKSFHVSSCRFSWKFGVEMFQCCFSCRRCMVDHQRWSHGHWNDLTTWYPYHVLSSIWYCSCSSNITVSLKDTEHVREEVTPPGPSPPLMVWVARLRSLEPGCEVHRVGNSNELREIKWNYSKTY